MALTYNGTTPTAVTYNGTNLTQINYNSVTVWTSRINLIYDGIINSDVTVLKESYHTTQTNYSVVNNSYRVQSNSWSGANFSTTVARLQTLNTSNFNTITINFTNVYSNNDGYGQGYFILVPKGADYPKFSAYHQQTLVNNYVGFYFSGYSTDHPSGTYDIDISNLNGDYDILIGISGYNGQSRYVDVKHIIAY